MSTWLALYWYVPLAGSTLYTIGSVWWTFKAERRIRALMKTQRIHEFALRFDAEDRNRFESYVERRFNDIKGKESA